MRLFAILVGIGAATSAIAHPGGLAADGCHNDRKNGGRHATARREERHLRLIARSERWAATSISLIAQWRVPPELISEERRVGKARLSTCSSRWSSSHSKQKTNTTP